MVELSYPRMIVVCRTRGNIEVVGVMFRQEHDQPLPLSQDLQRLMYNAASAWGSVAFLSSAA